MAFRFLIVTKNPPNYITMITKRSFLFFSRVITWLYLALHFFKSILPFQLSGSWSIVILGMILLLMGISHFKERRLPYFYPSLFMYAVVLALLGWLYYGGGK